jgi:hypothetical protein
MTFKYDDRSMHLMYEEAKRDAKAELIEWLKQPAEQVPWPAIIMLRDDLVAWCEKEPIENNIRDYMAQIQ